MQTYNRQEAIQRINQLSKTGKAFICLINYTQDCNYIEEVAQINPDELLYHFNGQSNYSQLGKAPQQTITWTPTPISFNDYLRSFNIVRNNILIGNSFLTNLTCSTQVKTNLTLKDIFIRSTASYKIWLKGQFVCFSPEIFVRIHNGLIHSYPMKGTIDATLPDAAQQLLDNPKEMAEHATITDLIRNDLSMVAKHVRVDRYRYTDEIATNRGRILQTSTEITGELPNQYQHHLGEILFKLLPAGSITGAPKRKTVDIIRQAETYQRGFYTGIAGYFDGSSLDTTVMIRFIEEQAGKFFFKSGGGITFQSQAKDEYNEMIQKVYVPIY
ncbi:MAG: aminodeoxychorismate synthase component I [Bacteroides sp.]|jgi:para-aminobenzoate synthetase component 1|nr:aminodeoxychorismate synthase component I [Bacteroides sp.]